MRALQIILLTLSTLSGCIKRSNTIVPVNETAITGNTKTMTDSLTYLALGDSYTIGEAVSLDQSFPHQLSNALTANSYSTATPTIIAVTGWTTDNLINAISTTGITAKKFNFVTLLIGVNDQFQGLSQGNYKTKFDQVLKTAITFANGDTTKVFVVSIPDYGVTPFAGGNDAAIGPQIDQFNAINKAESLNAGVNYLNITDISREAATDPNLIAPDGLHPSAKMYGLWVKRLEPLVASRLKK